MQTAFGLDAIRNSHPIEVPVKNALEVDQIFDAISYLKGSSVIRMLSSHLGDDVFLLGVSNYLKAHKFSNATTNDLWSALSEASGQDINAFMDPWIRKIGFPVVTLAEKPGQITAQQSRFLLSGDVKAEEDETTWWVPLGLKTGPKTSEIIPGALTSKTDTIRNIDDSFYKINANQTGFYRTNYPPARLTKLGEARAQLSTEDRIGLVGDAAALSQSGNATTAAFLALVELFKDEKEYIVWQQILVSLGNIRSIFADVEDVSKGLTAFTLKLVTPATDKVGLDFPAGEDLLTGQLRALLVSQAGLAGHKGVIEVAQARFAAFTSGKDASAIHPSLRSPFFRIAVNYGGKEAYEAVKSFYGTTTSIDGKEIALQSLGRVQSQELANKYLDFLFSDAVAVQDMHTGASSLAANAKTRPAVWNYIKKNWDSKVYPDLSGNMVLLERFLRMSLNKFSSHEVKKDIDSFFASKDNKGYDRGLGVVSDTVEGAAKYKERDTAVVRKWLSAHGYI